MRKRGSKEYQQKEYNKFNEKRMRKRSDPDYRREECGKRNEQRIRERTNEEYRAHEHMVREASSSEELIRQFHDKVSKGPFYICSCSDQIFYRHSVSCKENLQIDESILGKYFQGIISEQHKEWVCLTCLSNIKKDKCPPCALLNGMKFPDIPEELKGLNALEFRMLAARLPFMKMYAAAQGGQYKVRGNVVNIIADTASTISSLPRLPDDTCTIRVS